MTIWEPISPEDKLTRPIIEHVFNHQKQVKDMVLAVFRRNVFLEEWDIDKEPSPYPERINRIERNLEMLVGSIILDEPLKTIRWLGELNDIRRLDYTDVNRWFRMMELLYEISDSYKHWVRITGTFYCGDRADFQIAQFHYPKEATPSNPNDLFVGRFYTGNHISAQILGVL
jgi:hypothetical protein